MKKRIFLIFVLLTTFIAIIGTIALTKVYYDFYSDNIKAEIRTEAALIKENLAASFENSEGYPALLASTDREISPFTRITIINTTGKVLFDTDTNTTKLENHLTRPEIISAGKTGSGEAVRFSETLGKDAYYYALKLDDGSYLRLSRQLESIWTVFSAIIPLVIVILLLLLIFSFLAASFLTKMIIKPVNRVSERLDILLEAKDDDIYDIPVYDELIPFIHKIKLQKSKINQQIEILKAERDTIGSISTNMREGLILLDKNRHIIAINNSARSMLRIEQNNVYIGESIFSLTRNIELLATIENTLFRNEEKNFTDQSDGHYLRYYISPVNIDSEDKAEGVMIFILDVSNEVKGEKIRRDFAANVSHELKTPLTSINGFAEMISTGMIKDDDDIRKSAHSIQKEAARLLTLINEIMRLSQIESGLIEQEAMTDVYLPDILTETVHSLEHSLEARKVIIDYCAEELTIRANRQMIFELLFNLIDNAIKYNIENGTIKIAITKNDASARITISDTGIGIEPQHQERIFERFYRVDKSRSKQSGGTGLGLSIVKHIVEYHHGQISLQSVVDQGTTVTVDLPLINN